jgi:hypothetical protein
MTSVSASVLMISRSGPVGVDVGVGVDVEV